MDDIKAACKAAEAARMKRYTGGAVHNDVAADRAMITEAVHKHESKMHPGAPKTGLGDIGSGKAKVRMDRPIKRASGGRIGGSLAAARASEGDSDSGFDLGPGAGDPEGTGSESGGKPRKGAASTTINVIVAPQGGKDSATGGPPGPLPPGLPMAPPGAMPGPPAGPMPGPAALPPPPPGPGPVAGGPGPMMPPMMGRKTGGRVPEAAGAGGGLGRLKKAKGDLGSFKA